MPLLTGFSSETLDERIPTAPVVIIGSFAQRLASRMGGTQQRGDVGEDDNAEDGDAPLSDVDLVATADQLAQLEAALQSNHQLKRIDISPDTLRLPKALQIESCNNRRYRPTYHGSRKKDKASRKKDKAPAVSQSSVTQQKLQEKVWYLSIPQQYPGKGTLTLCALRLCPSPTFLPILLPQFCCTFCSRIELLSLNMDRGTLLHA